MAGDMGISPGEVGVFAAVVVETYPPIEVGLRGVGPEISLCGSGFGAAVGEGEAFGGAFYFINLNAVIADTAVAPLYAEAVVEGVVAGEGVGGGGEVVGGGGTEEFGGDRYAGNGYRGKLSSGSVVVEDDGPAGLGEVVDDGTVHVYSDELVVVIDSVGQGVVRDLAEVGAAINVLGLVACQREAGKEHSGEDGDDGDHHEELDERERG